MSHLGYARQATDSPSGRKTKPRLAFMLDAEVGQGTLSSEDVTVFRLSPYVTSAQRTDFLRTAKRLGLFVETLAFVGSAASEWYPEFVVYGALEDMHSLYVERMLDVVQVEQFVSCRLAVVAQGSAPAQACERLAYKNQQREMRQGKAVRALEKDSRHTSDDDAGAAAQGSKGRFVRVPAVFLVGTIGSGAYQVQLRLFNVWGIPAWQHEPGHVSVLPMDAVPAERVSSARRKSRKKATKERIAAQEDASRKSRHPITPRPISDEQRRAEYDALVQEAQTFTSNKSPAVPVDPNDFGDRLRPTFVGQKERDA